MAARNLPNFRRELNAYEAGAATSALHRTATPEVTARRRCAGPASGPPQSVGAEAKRIKKTTRQRSVLRPSRDRREILDAAAPVVQAPPKSVSGFPLALPEPDPGIAGREPR